MTPLLAGLACALVLPASAHASAPPSPTPADVVPTPDPDLVTPGTIGFLVTFGVAVALVLLVRDMVRRNRGLVVRAERRDAELRAETARSTGPAGPGDPDSPGGPGGPGAPATRPEQPGTGRERGGREGQGPAAPNG